MASKGSLGLLFGLAAVGAGLAFMSSKTASAAPVGPGPVPPPPSPPPGGIVPPTTTTTATPTQFDVELATLKQNYPPSYQVVVNQLRIPGLMNTSEVAAPDQIAMTAKIAPVSSFPAIIRALNDRVNAMTMFSTAGGVLAGVSYWLDPYGNLHVYDANMIKALSMRPPPSFEIYEFDRVHPGPSAIYDAISAEVKQSPNVLKALFDALQQKLYTPRQVNY